MLWNYRDDIKLLITQGLQTVMYKNCKNQDINNSERVNIIMISSYYVAGTIQEYIIIISLVLKKYTVNVEWMSVDD